MLRPIGILSALCLVAASATAQRASVDSGLRAADARPQSVLDTADVLRAGDAVRLRIWREPDLSGDFPVDETGTVVFPMIGAMRVNQESPSSLKARLVTTYQSYLSHSSIDVTFLRRVQVLGAVRNPGLYPLDATMTIDDALALAGGTTPQGNTKKLELIRRGERVVRTLSRQARVSDTPIRSGDQLYVPERSWISRNPYFVAGVVTTMLSLAVRLWTD